MMNTPPPSVFPPHRPPSPDLITAEYARQSAHLARGSEGSRGEILKGGALRAMWCRRTDTTMRSLLCAVFVSDSDAEDDPAEGLLAEHRPDGAIIRRIGADGPKRRLWIQHRALFISLGVIETWEILPLPGDFDGFVSALGKVSRAHVRSSLRHFERLGMTHEVIVGPKVALTDEILALAARNMPKPLSPHRLGECLRDANAREAPFQSILRAADGSVVSVVFGYVSGDYAMLICQLNPHDAPKIGQAGCSLLHRALLIRTLIGRSLHGLIMVNGCSGMLRPYCRPVRAETFLTVALNPLSWIRCLIYFLARPYLWTFLFDGLAIGRPRR